MIPQQTTTPLIIKILSLLSLSLLIGVSGCSSNPKKQETPLKSEQAYYSSAQSAIKAKNYFLAIEHLQKIETHYPFGQYIAQSQLDAMFAHYESGDYESAKTTAKRFIQQNPQHSEVAYAYYISALATYDVDRGFVTRVLPTTPAQRSIKPVKDSYQAFKKLASKFPKSQYSADARQRMIYLRNILAEHEIEVGLYYLRRGAHLAAVNRGQYVLQHFPLAPSVPQALALTTKGYMELEMDDMAEKHLQLLIENFPSYAELDKGQLNYTRQSLRSKRSWLNIISFGLIGSNGT